MTTELQQSLRSKLLASFERRYTTVPVPGIGTFTIRNLNETELCDYNNSNYDPKGKWSLDLFKQFHRRLVIACVVDEETKQPLFTAADMKALGEVDGVLIDALYQAAFKHCSPDRGNTSGTKKTGDEASGSDQQSG